ncbi:DivIVA domain-containing protein [Desmospora profundinema]|uniref:DivIVA domain-containing protein n=1 Tax=Desmospora profundinema TaxID=1571184 RepID=A0ABU1IJQ4_9BACL|nr:DivIVA domain-containing protein [Desmospora profundinema]MDR6224996.1 DivIVA domain-containing protein [Desmospora profundinema]
MQRLTPRDIFDKDFKTTLRGYDVDEVNEFLDLIIKNYEDVLEENEQLKEELKRTNSRGKRGQAVGPQDQVIQDILMRLDRLEQMMRR